MIDIKKVLRFIGNIGKCLTMIIFLFGVAILCVSIKLSKENVANPFCLNQYENENLQFNYQEIKNYDYYFQCSTLYIELEVDESLTKEQILSLIVSIGNDLKEYNCFTHFQVDSNSLNKSLYATINLKTNEMSYVGG